MCVREKEGDRTKKLSRKRDLRTFLAGNFVFAPRADAKVSRQFSRIRLEIPRNFFHLKHALLLLKGLLKHLMQERCRILNNLSVVLLKEVS